VITNHVGYDYNLPKHAIIKADSKQSIDKFELIAANTGQTVYEGSAVYSGPVFFNLLNPQQISLTAYRLFKTYVLLQQKPGIDYRQYLRRIMDEVTYGADYLARMQVNKGSCYRSGAARRVPASWRRIG